MQPANRRVIVLNNMHEIFFSLSSREIMCKAGGGSWAGGTAAKTPSDFRSEKNFLATLRAAPTARTARKPSRTGEPAAGEAAGRGE